jgi:hypothetical protein
MHSQHRFGAGISVLHVLESSDPARQDPLKPRYYSQYFSPRLEPNAAEAKVRFYLHRTDQPPPASSTSEVVIGMAAAHYFYNRLALELPADKAKDKTREEVTPEFATLVESLVRTERGGELEKLPNALINANLKIGDDMIPVTDLLPPQDQWGGLKGFFKEEQAFWKQYLEKTERAQVRSPSASIVISCFTRQNQPRLTMIARHGRCGLPQPKIRNGNLYADRVQRSAKWAI